MRGFFAPCVEFLHEHRPATIRLPFEQRLQFFFSGSTLCKDYDKEGRRLIKALSHPYESLSKTIILVWPD